MVPNSVKDNIMNFWCEQYWRSGSSIKNTPFNCWMLPASPVVTYIQSTAKLLHLEASLGLLNLQILPAQGDLSKSTGKTRLIYTSKWHQLNVTCIRRTIKTENKIKVGSETNNNILSASLLAFKLCGSELQSSYGILFCASSSAHR